MNYENVITWLNYHPKTYFNPLTNLDSDPFNELYQAPAKA